MLASLLPACREQGAAFKQLSRVKADESRLVVFTEPSRITILNDSILLAIVNENTITEFNYRNGKLIREHKPQDLPVDSLVRDFYKPAYTDRTYLLPTKPFNKAEQMPDFRIYDLQLTKDPHVLLLAATISSPYYFKNNPADTAFNYSSCIIYYDLTSDKLTHIIPFITDIPKTPHFGFFASGFYFYDSSLFVNLYSSGSLDNKTPCLASYKTLNVIAPPVPLPVYYPAVFPKSWIFYNFFREQDKQLMVSNQEAVYDAASGKPIYSGLVNNKNHEFLMNFKQGLSDPGIILYHIFYNNTSQKSYSNYLAAFNIKKGSIQKKQITPSNTICMTDFYKDQAVTMHKEGEYFYFTVYAYEP